MKIGLVCPYSLARGGGVQELIMALQRGLNERGHDAVIISQRPKEFKNKNKKGVVFLGGSVDFRSPMQTNALLSASITTEEIDEMLAREKFDILHFHEPWQPVLSRQILTRSNSVNIATFHAKVLETVMARTVMRVVTPYTRSVLEYLDTITAVSPAAADYVRTLTDKEIHIVPNGIDLEHFKAPKRPDNTAEGTKTILYIGRLERRKGLKYLLNAYKVVSQNRDDVDLVIAGDGVDRAKLEQYAAQLELPRVKFLGQVSDAKKVELLRTAELFVSPAIHGESFGIVLLEAMASGLPTVAGDNQGYSHLMQGLGALSLVNVRDAIEFARRMELMLSEPTLRKLWREWAADYVKQFSYDNVISQYEAVYEESIRKDKQKQGRSDAYSKA